MGIFPPHPSLPSSHNRKAEAVERNRNGNKAGIVVLKKPLAAARPAPFGDNGYTDESQLLFQKTYLTFSLEKDLKILTKSLL